MSNPLRIALVAEGPTDGVVIESALKSILAEARRQAIELRLTIMRI
jgi:hypothetical protein